MSAARGSALTVRLPMSAVMALFLAFASLSACVHKGESVPAEEYKAPLGAAPRSLLEDAEARLEQGDITMAHSQAERVYRMRPQDFRVLFLLARIARASESPADAEQWAYMALETLQPQHVKERRQVWEFIASCREEMDDRDGAAAALKEADRGED